jgi:uncharacterized protein
VMFSLQSYPPDPALVGERWREMWLERLEHLPLLADNWLQHQRRDDYWRHGSVGENYADIACAVYAIGGWADGYSNTVPRLLAGLRCPKKGLIGPWAHQYPHFAEPGPRIGFLHECLRWWDQWLKGRDSGIMSEPVYRVWMEEWAPPQSAYRERAGRWVAEPAWPSPNLKTKTFIVNAGGLEEKPKPEAGLILPTRLGVGLLAGHWCPYGVAPDLPSDQREEDGQSLVFDSPALEETIEILGAPVVHVEFSADRPQAQLCVRLNDVARDGSSLRVSYGLLNLTHRRSHEHPEPLEPGRRYRVRIQLNDAAHAFPRGHRVRLSVSSSYWPIAWPSPENAEVTLFAGTSHLELPARAARADDEKLPAFGAPESPAPMKKTVHREPWSKEGIERDLVTGQYTFTTEENDGDYTIHPVGLRIEHHKHERFTIREADPLSAVVETAHSHKIERGEWRVRTETQTRMGSTAAEFVLQARLDAFEGERRILSRNWHLRRPRDLV